MTVPEGCVVTLTVQTPVGDLQRVVRWGPGTRDPVWYLTCPLCDRRAEIDADQFYGRVSVKCDEPCSYHETWNFHLVVDHSLLTLARELRDERGDRA